MITLGKFTLFDFGEFSSWLSSFAVTRSIRMIQNHHTWLPDYSTFNGHNHFALLQSMEASHLARGFSEIAQNLTTFPDGKIALCRSLDKIPAGIKGANSFGVCIENVGNFDAGRDVMTDLQKEVIVRTNAALCRKFKLSIDTRSIVYHHWFDLITGQRTDGAGTTKTCPGTNFFGGNSVQSCNANFLPYVASAVSTLTGFSDPPPSITQHGTVNVPLLNVRSLGSTAGTILKVLHQGTPINIYEEKNGWYRIDNTSQWVKGEYVDIG